MIIKTVNFTVEKSAEKRFENKVKQDIESMKSFEGCLFAECWKSENKENIEFLLVSKWKTKHFFQQWLKRPEHIQKHRDAHKNKEQHIPVIISKKAKEYACFL